jgi:hypothetical protein
MSVKPMSYLPTIDTAKFIPSRAQINQQLADLSTEVANFSEQYDGYLERLSIQGLADCMLWYGRIQESAVGIFHVAEFIEEKYRLENPEAIEEAVAGSMNRTAFFSNFLLRTPVITLEALTRNPELARVEPLILFLCSLIVAIKSRWTQNLPIF